MAGSFRIFRAQLLIFLIVCSVFGVAFFALLIAVSPSSQSSTVAVNYTPPPPRVEAAEYYPTPAPYQQEQPSGQVPDPIYPVAAAAGTYAFDAVLNAQRVNVSGHYRGDTYVNEYTRQPPGGHSFNDYGKAAAAAVAVTATIVAIDKTANYVEKKHDQYEAWKAKREEAKARKKAQLDLEEFLKEHARAKEAADKKKKKKSN